MNALLRLRIQVTTAGLKDLSKAASDFRKLEKAATTLHAALLKLGKANLKNLGTLVTQIKQLAKDLGGATTAKILAAGQALSKLANAGAKLDKVAQGLKALTKVNMNIVVNQLRQLVLALARLVPIQKQVAPVLNALTRLKNLNGVRLHAFAGDLGLINTQLERMALVGKEALTMLRAVTNLVRSTQIKYSKTGQLLQMPTMASTAANVGNIVNTVQGTNPATNTTAARMFGAIARANNTSGAGGMVNVNLSGVNQATSSTAKFASALSASQKNIFSFLGALATDKIIRFGQRIQWAGRQIEYTFSLPILLAGAAATKWAFAQEAAMVRVGKVYGDTATGAQQFAQDIGKLEEAFTLLSDIYGVNRAEVIDVGAAWAKAGLTGASLAQATRNTMDAMILGEMTATEATEGLIAVQQQYKISTLDLKKAIGTLNAVENESAVRFDGLVEALKRGGGVARSVGVDIRHFAALVSALVPAAGSAEQAGNALKTIFSRLASPTQEMLDIFGKLGLVLDSQQWQSSNGAQKLEILAENFNNLSSAQRGIASSVLASRFQINKFEVLMDDIIRQEGNYQRSLRATADETATLNQYQKELQLFLESSPQAWQILKTQIQNTLARAIVPIIPTILAVISKLRDLIASFNELSPATKQMILLGLAMLALVGPAARIFGAFNLLVGVMGKFFGWFIGLPGAIVSALGDVVGVFWAMASGIGAALSGAWASVTGFIASIAALPIIAKVAVIGAIVAAIAGIAILISSGQERLGAFGQWIKDFFKPIGEFISKIWTGIADVLGKVLSKMAEMIGGFFSGIGNFFGGLFGQDTKNVSSANAMEQKLGYAQQAAAASETVAQAEEVAVALDEAATTAAALRGTLIQVAGAGDLANLEAFIDGATVAMDRFTAATATAKAELEASQWDSVRSELLAAVPEAGPVFDQMLYSLTALKSLLPPLDAQIKAEESSLRSLTAAYDAASKAVDDQRAAIDKLQEVQSKIGNDLEEAKSRYDEFANAQIEGSGAAADALFDNEMAQKALRLEIARLKDVLPDIEETQNKYDALSSSIADLQKTATDMMNAGAGSDVLGPINAQLDAMKAARDALEVGADSPAARLKELQDQLDDLQNKAEIIDLERALKFDPLNRELDKVKSNIKEMPFDVLMAGLQSSKGDVDKLQAAYDDATAAVKAQEESLKALEATQSAARAAMEAQQTVVDNLKDSYSQVNDMISQVEDAINSLSSTVSQNRIETIFDAGENGDFTLPGGTLGEIENLDFDALLSEWSAEAQKSFGKFDPFGPLREKIDSFKVWWRTEVRPAWDEMWEKLREPAGKAARFFRETWDKIKEAFDKFWNSDTMVRVRKEFGEFFSGLKEEIKKWQEDAGPILEALGNVAKVVGGAIYLIWKFLEPIIGPAFSLILDLIKYTLMGIRGIVEVIAGILSGDAGMIKKGLGTLKEAYVDGAWEIAKGIIEGLTEGIKSYIRWMLVEPLKAIWDWLVEGVKKLLGINSPSTVFMEIGGWIIQGLIDGIWGAITGLAGIGRAIMVNIWNGLVGFWNETVWPFVSGLAGRIGTGIGNTWEWLKNKGRGVLGGLWNGLVGFWNETIWPFFTGLGRRIVDSIGNIYEKLFSVGKSIMVGIWNGFVEGFKVIKDIGGWLLKPFQWALGGLADWLGIASPSKRTMEMGRNIMLGFQQGLDKEIDGVTGRLENLGMTSSTDLSVQSKPVTTHQKFVFHGDLSFPNITDPNDADEFIENLTALV